MSTAIEILTNQFIQDVEILTNKFIQDVKNLWELEKQRVIAKEQVERNLMECEDVNMIVKEVKKVMIDDDPILPIEPQFNPVTKEMDNVKKVEKPVLYSREDCAKLLISWERMVRYEKPKVKYGNIYGNRTFNDWRRATIGQMRKFIDQNGINLQYADDFNKMERGLEIRYNKNVEYYEDVGIDREELRRRREEHLKIIEAIPKINQYNEKCEDHLCEKFILYQYNGGDPTELFRICDEYKLNTDDVEFERSSEKSVKELLDMYYELDDDTAKDLFYEMVEDDCEKLYVIATEGTINQRFTGLSDYTIFRKKIEIGRGNGRWDIKKSKTAPDEFKHRCKTEYFYMWKKDQKAWLLMSDEDRELEIGKKIGEGSYMGWDDSEQYHNNYEALYEKLRRPTIERIERYYEISVRGFVMK